MELTKKDIHKIWFADEHIHLKTATGEEKAMPLRWFPALKNATDKERENYELSHYGIHWEALDMDLSFNGFFTYDKDKISQQTTPTEIQQLFARFPFINITEFSRLAGINPVLMRHYVCGVKSPGKRRSQHIRKTLHKIGEEMMKY